MDLYITTTDNVEHYLEVELDDTIQHVLDKIPETRPGYIMFNGKMMSRKTKVSDTGIESQGHLEWRPSWSVGGYYYPPMMPTAIFLEDIIEMCEADDLVGVVTLALDDDDVEFNTFEVLNTAIEKEYTEVFKVLINHPRVTIGMDDRKLLRTAINADDDTFLEEILKDGCIDPSKSPHVMSTVCERGDESKVQLFIDDGRIMSRLSESGGIYYAADAGFMDISKMLLDTFTHSELEDALSEATDNGNLDIVRLLVEEYNIDPSANDNAAIANISHLSYEVLMYLLADERVDPSVQDQKALKYALSFDSVEMVTALIQHPRSDPMALTDYTADELPPIEDHEAFAEALIQKNRPRLQLMELVRSMG